MYEQEPPPLFKPEAPSQLSSVSLAHLKASAPWMRFIAITSIVCCAFIVLVALCAVAVRPYSGIVFIFYLLFAVASFFPHLYLLQCANNIRDYLASNDNALIEKAFERQRSFWTYLGIMVIIYLAILLILILIMIVAGAAFLAIFRHGYPYNQY